MDQEERENDFTVYKQLLDLWSKENPIKTNKLQVLLVVNGLLLSAVNIGKGFIFQNWPLYLGGALFSLVWVLSIGRTSLFQEVWQVKIDELAKKHPEDSRFQIHKTEGYMGRTSQFLRIAGCVSSKYYLVGAPFVFFMIWLCIFFYFVLFS